MDLSNTLQKLFTNSVVLGLDSTSDISELCEISRIMQISFYTTLSIKSDNAFVPVTLYLNWK